MRLPARLFLLGFLLLIVGATGMAAVTVKDVLDPPEANVGDEVTVTYTVQGGSIDGIQLPPVDGLSVTQSRSASQFVMNGFTVSQSYSQMFTVVPIRAGDFTIPSFGIRADDGQIIHTQPLRLHVLGGGSAPATPAAPAPTPPSSPGNGPVVMPPDANGQTTTPPTGNNPDNDTISVPTGADGRPARVFHLITPTTTDAYVGESIPLTIQFYIRADSNAQQNSLPTLIGSDFLMNNLSLRPRQDGVGIANEEYIRNTWMTAISAPRPGDFPLEATRDTYWAEGENYNNDPFGALFGRNARLMHKEVGSNKLVIHVHPLPDQGKPANFTGAIGKFQVAGNAEPGTVGVGEPVTLHFTVSGQGNFDYVRAPSLAADPAWKSYVPASKVQYEEESHTQATKTFDQSIIPQKNGVLTLPPASFSYFDPDAKNYVTTLVPLPSIVVTGSMPAVAATPAPVDESEDAVAAAIPPSAADGFAPNRLTFGTLTPSLAPLYRHPGFWMAQAGLGGLILLGLLLSVVRPRRDSVQAQRALRHASLQQEQDAMSRAVRSGDSTAFFIAARHAVQLQLAELWQASPPEALTLGEIGRRDPALGETVAPLFNEADAVIYSGKTRPDLDLAEWDQRVRGMLQPARL